MRVKVKPGSYENKIISEEEDLLVVAIKAPADKGKANKELVKFLSKHYGRQIRIKTGLASKEKILEFI